MKNLTLLALFLFLGISFAQENNVEITPSLSKQFDNLYNTSTSYNKYKAMKISDYVSIKKNVLDSINTQKRIIVEKTTTINKNRITITDLDKQVKYLSEKLEESESKNENRYFLGVKLDKSVYTIVLIATYFILIVLVVFFALKYQQNILNTKNTIKKYDSLFEEFEAHKKTSLKRFQEVNRRLQDELNKNWKKDN